MLGCYDKLDLDIAIFTNLTRYHMDFTKQRKIIERPREGCLMVDPEWHRIVVNIDDTNSPYFLAQGNPNVYAMGNKNANVYALEVQLSLFET